jgi:tRNA(fMet)-specific endonuclease VapC
MFALDTNTVSYYFKGIGAVHENLVRVPWNDVGVPAVVLYELESGVAVVGQQPRRRRLLDEFSRKVLLLPFDADAALAAAEIRAELSSLGQMIGPLDILIAGTALARGAILVTHNTREYSRVPGLRLIDWY